MTEITSILLTMTQSERILYRQIGGKLPRLGRAPEPVWHTPDRASGKPKRRYGPHAGSRGMSVRVTGTRLPVFKTIRAAALRFGVNERAMRDTVYRYGKKMDGRVDISVLRVARLVERLRAA